MFIANLCRTSFFRTAAFCNTYNKSVVTSYHTEWLSFIEICPTVLRCRTVVVLYTTKALNLPDVVSGGWELRSGSTGDVVGMTT